MCKKKVTLFFFAAILINQYGNAQQLIWTKVLPGIWKGITGKPEAYNLLKAAAVLPNKAADRKSVV